MGCAMYMMFVRREASSTRYHDEFPLQIAFWISGLQWAECPPRKFSNRFFGRMCGFKLGERNILTVDLRIDCRLDYFC